MSPVVPIQAFGANYYWDPDGIAANNNVATGAGLGGIGSLNWDDSQTLWWDGSTYQAWPNITDGTAMFFGAGHTVNVSTDSISAAGLVFGMNRGSGFVLSASSGSRTITLGSGGVTLSGTALATTLGNANLGIALSANQSWTNQSNRLLTVGGNVNLNGNTLTVSNSSIGAQTFTGIVGGSGGVTVNSSGGGLVSFGSLNTYAGPTIVSGGVLQVAALANGDSASGIGQSSNSAGNLILDGGTLRIIPAAAAQTSDRLLTLTNNGGALESASTTVARLVNFNNTGAVAFSGSGARTFTLGGVNTGANAFALMLGDGTGGATSLVKAGAGSWTISAAHTYTGSTTVSGGTLTVGGAASSIANSSAITVSGGKLAIDSALGNVDRIGNGVGVTLGAGGELSITGNGATNTTESVGKISLTSGNAILTVISGGAGRVTSLAGSSFERTNHATALVRGSSMSQNIGTDVSRITLTDASGLTFVGTNTLSSTTSGADSTQSLKIVPYLLGSTSINGDGSNFVTYDSSVSLTLGLRVLTANQGTPLSAGMTTDDAPVNAVAAAVTIGASALTVNSLLFSSATTVQGASTALTVDSGAVAAVTGANVIANNFSSLTLGNGTWNEGIISVIGSSATLAVNTPINVTVGGALTKAGAGTLTLGAANLYGGGTFINAGTVSITTDANLGSGSGGITFGGTGTLFISPTESGAIDFSSARGISLSAGTTGTISLVTTVGLSAEFLGAVTGSGTLVISGATNSMAVHLNSTENTFSGDIRIITASNSTTGGISVASIEDSPTANGIIHFEPGSATGFPNFWWNGTESLTIDYRRFELTTGNGSVANNSADVNDILKVNTDLLVAASAGPRAFRLNGSNTGNNEYAGKIADGMVGTSPVVVDLSKEDNGTWIVSGENTYTGKTTINRGMLVVSSLNSVANGMTSSNLGAPTTVGNGTIGFGFSTVSGTLVYIGAGETTDRVIDLITTNSGGAVIDQSGTGTLKFTSALAISGTGTTAKSFALRGSTSGTGEFAGAIINSATSLTNLTKSGTGTWVLSSANTYTGTTTINDGILKLSGAGTIGNNTLTTGQLTLGGGQLDLGGLSRTVGAVSITGAYASGDTLRNGTLTAASYAVTNAAGTAAVVSANLGGSTGLTKTGAGTLTLSGTNTYTGLTSLGGTGAVTLAGTLNANGGVTLVSGQAVRANINSPGALGTGMFTYSSSSQSIDNTSGAAVTLTTNPQQTWNATLTFAGSNDLNMGTGAVTLGAGAANLTINGSTLTIGGLITGTNNSLQKLGVGTLVLNGGLSVGTGSIIVQTDGGTLVLGGTSNYSGATSVNGGGTLTLTGTNSNGAGGVTLGVSAALNINSAAGLGANGALTINGGTIDNTSGSPIVVSTANAQNWSGNFIFNGSNDLSLGTGTVNLTGTRTVTVNAGTLTVGGIVTSVTNNFGITKAGPGTLVLSNAANSHTGVTTIQDGKLSVSSIKDLSVASSLGAPTTSINGTIALGATTRTGTLLYTGTGDTTNRIVHLAALGGGGGVIDQSGTGLLKFTSDFTAATSDKTFTLQGSTTGSGELAGRFVEANAGNKVSLLKLGTGTWTLSGANVYTGSTTINEGILALTGAGKLNSNVGALNLGGGQLDLGGTTQTVGAVSVTTASTTADLLKNGTLNSNTSFTISADEAVTISAFLGGTGGLTKTGTGTLTLSDTNSYSGATAVHDGTLSVSSLKNALISSSLGAASAANNRIALGSSSTTGTLLYTGTGDSTSRGIALAGETGGGVIQNDGSGALVMNNATVTAPGLGNKTLTLQGTNNDANALNGVLADSAGFSTSLVKAGSGSWSLGGASTYTGATTINQGTLKLGASGSIDNSSGIAIAGGATYDVTAVGGYALAQTLTAIGTGTANVTGTVNAAGQTLDLESGTDLGTLAFGAGLTLNGSTLRFDLGSAGSDLITIAGSASIGGSNTISLATLNGTTSLLTGMHAYTLVTAGGGWNFAAFTLSTTQLVVGGTTYTLELSGDATNQYLDVTEQGASPANVYWKGTASTLWTADANWTSDAAGTVAATTPTADANVTFSAAGATNLATSLGANRTINSLNFAASQIAAVTVADNGLTLNAAAVNGNAAGSGLTVAAGSGAHTISSAVTLSASQTWTNNSSNPLTVSGVIGGAQALSLAGTGTFAFSGANTFSGGLSIIGGGTVVLTGDNSAATGAVQVQNGTLQLGTGGSLAVTTALTLGNAATSGKLVLGDAIGAVHATLASLTASGIGTTNQVVGGNGAFSTLTIGNAVDVLFAGMLGGAEANENNLNLVKNGAGTLELTGTNTYDGTTTINAGTLSIAHALAGTVYLNGGNFIGAGAGGSNVVFQGGTQTVSGDRTADTTVAGGTTSVASGATISGSFTQTDGATNIQSGGATTGAISVSGGLFTVQNGGSASSTSGIDVGAGAEFVVDLGGSVGGNGPITVGGTFIANGDVGAGSSTITVEAGGTLQGSGTVDDVVIQSDGTLSTGNSVESLVMDDLTLAGGVNVFFEFKNAVGATPGTDWDLIDLGSDGILDLGNATAGNRINLRIDSWQLDNGGHGGGVGDGDYNNFNPQMEYEWLFVKTADLGNLAMLGDDDFNRRFNIIDSFTNAGVFNGTGNPFERPMSSLGQGTFTVGWHDGAQGLGLYVHYSAIPEPGSMALCGLSALAAGWYGRRRINKVTTAATTFDTPGA